MEAAMGQTLSRVRGENLIAAATKRLLALALITLIGFAAACGPGTAPAQNLLAMANPEVLQQIPCYCGCGPQGHKSNYDSYVSSQDTSGNLIYDPHALTCRICVDITQDTMRLLRAGVSPSDIRAYVDVNYARYGPSNMPTGP
jgi:hypothetical protein